MLGLSASLSKASVTLLSFFKDNLKLFFDFKNTDLEHVGTGSANFVASSSQSLTIPTAVLDDASAFTIMAWAKKGSLGDADGLVICGNATAGFYYRGVNATSITASVALDGSNAVVTTSSFTDTTDWMHFALTYDGSTVTSYVNGESKATNTSGSGVVTSGSTINRIGEYGTTFHNGKLKNFGVWHRALNVSEIQNVMFKTYSELKGSELTHLQSWYALESSTLSGSDATGNNDITANNNTVTFTNSIYGGNTPTKPRGVDNSKATLADQIGSGSASFDGDDDYIDCGLIDFDTNDVSIVAWYKANAFDDPNAAIVNNRDSDTSTGKKGIQIRVDSGGDDIELFTDCGGTTFSTKTDSFVPVVGVWTHVAATIDRSALQSLYINGALQATTNISGESSTDLTNTDNFVIGRDEGSNFFNGNIAQVGVWVGRVLTQEEIQSISQKQYSELTTSEKTNLTSWWGLDEVFLGSNTRTDSHSATFYDRGQIVEDKAGTLSTILVDNYDTLDNWEELNANSSLSRNADGNLVITASGGSAGARLKSSFTTLETNTMYLAELAVAGGTDTSIYFRLDDEAFAGVQYGNGYMTPATNDQEFPISNTTPECVAYRFKSDSTNTGLYVTIGNIDDGKTAIIKSFKLYKIVSGNYGVLTDA